MKNDKDLNRPSLVIRRATLICDPYYTCMQCGCQEKGSSQATIIINDPITDLGEVFNNNHNPVANNHMPIGWASYMEGYKCPDCLT